MIRRTEKAAYDLFMSGDGQGHHPPGRRTRGGRSRAPARRLRDGRLRVRHLPRTPPRDGPRRHAGGVPGRADEQGDRAVQGQGRLDAPHQGRPRECSARTRSSASHLPMAAGAAWSAKLRGTEQVAVAFFGDGATNIGAFHEALNLAAVWKLPVLFVCENNLYMEYTPIASVTAVANPAADRAAAYGLPAEIVDGNDVVAVHDAMSGRRRPGARRRAGRR